MKLFKSSIIYVFANIINASVPFIILPILTNYLSPSDYGILTIFVSIIAILASIVCFNTDAYIQRKLFDSPSEIKESLAASTIITLVIALIFYLFIYLTNITIFDLSNNLLLIAVVYSLTLFFYMILLINYQVKNKGILYGIFQVSYTSINLGVSLIGIVLLDLLYFGRVLGYSISSFILGITSLYLLYNKFKPFKFPSLGRIKEALLFGGGLLPHTIGNGIILYSSRFFVLEYESSYDLGLFYTAIQICSVFSLLFLSVNTAFVPWLFEQLNKKDYLLKQKIVGYTYLFMIISTMLILIFIWIAPYLVKMFLNQSFHGSILYLLPIAFAFLFQAMFYSVTNYIIYSKKTFHQSVCTLISALLGIVYNYYLVKYYGTYGAAVAFSLTYFTLFFTSWIASNIVFKMPWDKPVFFSKQI